MKSMRGKITRADGRNSQELRPVTFELNYTKYPEGSVLIRQGDTHVLCNVTVEETVPPWFRSGQKRGGWVTAEYAMLPRATLTRSRREASSSGARVQEIKRLVGRALRAAVDLEKLGGRTFTVDCDVLQADGGTRTASITGGYVALVIAMERVLGKNAARRALLRQVAAVSAGLLGKTALLDLDYGEDSKADADVNFVFTDSGELIEVQGTAEREPFPEDVFLSLLRLSKKGAAKLCALQRAALGRTAG